MIILLSCLLLAIPAAAQEADSVVVSKEAAGQVMEKPGFVVVRSIPDSVVHSWRKDREYAYANDPAYWQREVVNYSPGWFERLVLSKGFRYFFLILLGAVLLYAIIRIIMENNLRLFYRGSREKAIPARQEVEPIEEDLDSLLKQSLGLKEYRQAVRYLYLITLRLLNERGLIRYHQESTNREYLRQLSGMPPEASFRDLTLAYEKVWYGEFPLNEAQFERLHYYFEDFYKTCPS